MESAEQDLPPYPSTDPDSGFELMLSIQEKEHLHSLFDFNLVTLENGLECFLQVKHAIESILFRSF